VVDGLNAAGRETGVAFSAQHQGGMAGLYFRAIPPASFGEAQQQDLDRSKRFHHLMLAAGVYLPPSPVEAFFFSSVHSDDDIAHTLEAAGRSLAAVA
jgi:glutamate-1-semialdehyde 2,1-aminomutase